ncbi:porin [Gilvimarinus sp. SDUM040013]|uniref:Porin n=1 Tax=Gilvimarinus gilvus TaxID=3058038 RepID=A0ABU4RX50_9GAMM|nr:porin [Gilvimarinus sp. SDUM040013]MDO3386648.1 porin [Gilvimarinus sp. SDUM040013]MDX6849465.1 porin [Gilvimarinus sp. SDUM040013]
MFKKATLVVALAAIGVSAEAQETPTLEQMWEVIQQQKAEIEALKSELDEAEHKIEETDVRVETTASALDVISQSGGSQSSAANWTENTSLGGYGELHYNNLEDSHSDANESEIDFHRFVLFLGHDFNEKVRFFSEVEIEHSLAGDGKPGEVELEQAYIEYDYAQNHTIKSGLFLTPVGILNETHEPDTFFGVERNNVEKNIIPTTWWEAGVNLQGYLVDGLRYDLGVTSGLNVDAFEGKYKVRDGRQKVAEANANNAAYTGRIKYTAIPGLELATTLQYQSDLLQGELEQGAAATLFEAHAIYEAGGFGIRALYAAWDIDGYYEEATGKLGADKQEGWYVEPSYKFFDNFGVFARYSEWDNQAGTGLVDSGYSQIDVGVNYWLTPQVVFKADYQDQTAPDAKAEMDGLNLGVGYSF